MSLLRLELRKNALAAASVAAAMLMTAALAPLVAALSGLETPRAFESVFTLWRFLGIPLAAALVGTSCGTRHAADADRESEALLPAPAGLRFAAAAAASFLLFAAVSMPMFLCLAWQPFPMADSFRPTLFTGLGQTVLWSAMLLACFSAAVLTRNGVAGGLLGAAAAGTTLFPLGAAQFHSDPWDGPSDAWFLVALALIAAGPLLGALMACRRRALGHESLRGLLWSAACFLSGPALMCLLFGRILYAVLFDPSSLHTE